MEKRTLLLAGIPTAGLLVVANLLFFWLVPDVDCKVLVYCFCFGIIFIQGITSAILWYRVGAKKVMPVLVAGSSFAMGILVAGSIMVALSAPFRTALYFLILFTVLYLICVGFLSCVAVDELWDRVENMVIDPFVTRNPIREWLRSCKAAFSRRRPGESDAERQVRNNSEVNADPPPIPAMNPVPPPLPVNTIRRT